jgi:integrase
MRDNWLSNRVFTCHDDIVDHCCEAWNKLVDRPSPLGKMLHPDSFSEAFVNKVAEIEIKPITFHGLRHTHITLLLRSGVPVHVVSARAGHAKASITLDTYSHLLGGEDNDAAKQAEAILQRVLK